jgi:uncharacterized protein (UPF0303 family)
MTASFPSVAELAAEEAELQFSSFTDDDAWELGAALRELARRQEAPVAIDISRNGHQLFHAALAGATPDNDAWIERKQRVVHRFGHSTLHVRQTSPNEGRRSSRGPGWTRVVVSGLPQLEDHRLVVRALRAHLG